MTGAQEIRELTKQSGEARQLELDIVVNGLYQQLLEDIKARVRGGQGSADFDLQEWLNDRDDVEREDFYNGNVDALLLRIRREGFQVNDEETIVSWP